MPENYAFYTQTHDALPEKEMRAFAGKAKFSIETDQDGGRCFRYRWRDLEVACHEMPAHSLPVHLHGFAGWVRSLYGDKPDKRGNEIIDRINYTRLSVGIVIEPKRDPEGRAEQLLGAMANGLDALIFFGDALFDKNVRLILARDGSFDETADVLGPVADMIKDRIMVNLPRDVEYRATDAQIFRYERVWRELMQHRVPMLDRVLHVDDDEAVTLREPAEVARRLLVLSAVTLLADGAPRKDALALIERRNLWPAVSPKERAFLQAEKADPALPHQMLWRLESLWVLAWALGDPNDLGWPAGFCDVKRLVKILQRHEADADFAQHARLRSQAEILDAQQLTLLLHWAVTDARIHNRPIPEDLDWSGETRLVKVDACPVPSVVFERHYALNWLTRFADTDWDDVDTPT